GVISDSPCLPCPLFRRMMKQLLDVGQSCRQVVLVASLQSALPLAINFFGVLRDPKAVRYRVGLIRDGPERDVCRDNAFAVFRRHARKNTAVAINDLSLAEVVGRISLALVGPGSSHKTSRVRGVNHWHPKHFCESARRGLHNFVTQLSRGAVWRLAVLY